METELQKLRYEIEALKTEFYKNNFSARQDFYKFCDFKTQLKVPSYTSTPTTKSEIGELIEVGGLLYICTATTPTWTKVGLQV